MAIESRLFEAFQTWFEPGYDSKPALGISTLFDVIFLFKERTEPGSMQMITLFRKPGAPRLKQRNSLKLRYPYARKKKTESFNTIRSERRTGGGFICSP